MNRSPFAPLPDSRCGECSCRSKAHRRYMIYWRYKESKSILIGGELSTPRIVNNRKADPSVFGMLTPL
ncbi:MAG TPA: hypothetical protein PLI62_17870, partial [Spirochaetota bacterium]|nr:hypothetical protein [Spirochaetota bacterium]